MVVLTDKNFEQEVLKSDIPVLVDLYADWCGPCQMYSPIVEEIGQEYDGKIKVGKMNVDQNQATPAKYSILSIPTTLIFNNGRVIKQLVGMQTKEALISEINKLTN